MSKEVIATDIDEVLFPFIDEFSAWHNLEYGTTLASQDFKTYEFDDTLGVGAPETVHRIHTFLDAKHSHLGVSPLESAQESITRLSEEFKIVAITARHPQFESSTTSYLRHHFSELINDVTLVGHRDSMDVCRTKASICTEIGAVALIDDNIGHVLDCPPAGIQGILFGNYPWNQSEDLPFGVVRYDNWGAVIEHFGING